MKVKTNNGIELTLASTPFKKGGEGSIYKISNPVSYQSNCVKIYKDFDNPNTTLIPHIRKCEAKIKFITENQPSQISNAYFSLAWCKELVYDSRGRFLGFVMPLIFPNEISNDLNLLEPIDLHPKIRNDANWEKFKNTNPNYFINRLMLCANLASAVYTIHKIQKYVLVDFKPKNIVITNKGKIGICDIDSMQISNGASVLHYAQVSTPEYSPPESKFVAIRSTKIENSWDNFGIAVAFYQLLFGLHPFSNAGFKPPYHNASLPPSKIENGLFVFGEKAKTHLIKKDPLHENFNRLPKKLQDLFHIALDKGCFNPQARPSAEQWGKELSLAVKYFEERRPTTPKPVSKSPITGKPYVAATPAYTSTYQKSKTPLKQKDDDNSVFWVWSLIIAVLIIAIILYFKYGNSSSAESALSNNTSVNVINTNGKANTYGVGKGKVYFYKTCNYCPDLQVSIDGINIGSLSKTFSSSNEPSCDDYGTLSKVLSVGTHNYSAKDSYGATWSNSFTVYEGECSPKGLKKTVDVKPNPFGTGNGKITFYKTCNYCPDLEVSIDGNYVGTISQTLSESSTPSCDDYGTISKVLSSGSHQLTAKDSYGSTWGFQVYATEGECTPQKLYKSKDVKPNPYGAGNGKVYVYKTCINCPDLQVSIDGVNIGSLSQTFSSSNRPSCDDYGTLSKVLTAGNHNLTAKDSYGSTWSFPFTIKEGECSPQGLAKNKDVNPNPYGAGYGKVYFYKTCINCPDLQVSIDGVYIGSLSQTFSSSNSPSCDDYGTLSKVLMAGNHNLTAKESYGSTWSFPFTVKEGECSPQSLKKNNDVKPNPYGGDYGKASIWTSVSERFDIYLDNDFKGTVTQYFANGQPNCGQDGTLWLLLPAGQYSFYAKGSRNNWTGTLKVNKGECNLFKVNGK